MKKETIENIFNFLKEQEGKKIPQKWNIIETLENHPDDIKYTYEGSLFLYLSGIKKLPNYLEVKGYLDLQGCDKITELPNKLFVYGGAVLMGLKQLTKLPNIMFVQNNLFLSYSNITELPYQLFVGDDFYIIDTPLADKYTDEEIYKIVASTGGKINGTIVRSWKKIQ